jgi:riboflavin biosynthesis pyrimidine reductase
VGSKGRVAAEPTPGSLPLTRLYERAGLPAAELPAPLTELYGGGLQLTPPLTYANFVTSLDGVVALPDRRHSGTAISGRSQADRFVMGLLRALSDCVLVGAGTLRAEGNRALWTPEFIDPERSAAFVRLRQQLGRRPQVRLVVVTATGRLDAGAAALQAGALVLTTEPAAAALAERLPACRVRGIGEGPRLDPSRILAAVRDEGLEAVLVEGGPTLFGHMLEAGLVEELFLTISPVVAGREAGAGRLGLVEGAAFSPDRFRWSDLLSLRRAGSHLFARYRL